MKQIVIEEGDNFFRVRMHGILYANYHNEGLEFLRMVSPEHDLVLGFLVVDSLPLGDYSTLRVLIEQLREEGYFHGES